MQGIITITKESPKQVVKMHQPDGYDDRFAYISQKRFKLIYYRILDTDYKTHPSRRFKNL